jgi:hypothetical protein
VLVRPVPGTNYVDAASPYGYSGPVTDASCSDDGFLREAALGFREALRELGVVSCFVRLHPFLGPPPASLAPAGALVPHGQTVSIDLGIGDDEAWRQMRVNHRRQVQRALARGDVAAVDERWEALPEFIDMYRETMDRVGADPEYYFPDRYFERLRDELRGCAHLVTVTVGGALAGGGIVTTTGDVVEYHLGATRERYLGAHPTKLLIDHVRRWGRARGHRCLHLGGGVGAAADSLFHFKAGFSRVRHQFATWRLVLDPAAYAELVATADPAAADDLWFPAYRSSRPGAAAAARSQR